MTTINSVYLTKFTCFERTVTTVSIFRNFAPAFSCCSKQLHVIKLQFVKFFTSLMISENTSRFLPSVLGFLSVTSPATCCTETTRLCRTNLIIYFRFHETKPLLVFVSKIYPFHTLASYLFNVHFNNNFLISIKR